MNEEAKKGASKCFDPTEIKTNLSSSIPVIGWMIIIGDGIHNVTDGLAIGAAFSDSILVGVAQSVAVAFQELPSELGS